MIEADYYDKPSTQRVFGGPRYNENGDLVCRSCGAPMSASMSKNGTGTAVCTDTGCPAHSFEFAEGSYFNNPGRNRA